MQRNSYTACCNARANVRGTLVQGGQPSALLCIDSSVIVNSQCCFPHTIYETELLHCSTRPLISNQSVNSTDDKGAVILPISPEGGAEDIHEREQYGHQTETYARHSYENGIRAVGGRRPADSLPQGIIAVMEVSKDAFEPRVRVSRRKGTAMDVSAKPPDPPRGTAYAEANQESEWRDPNLRHASGNMLGSCSYGC